MGPKSRMRQRQRTALARLGILTSVAGGSAVLVGGRLWVVFGANAAAFAGYALLVARVRARQAEHRRKVRPLERAAAAHVQDGDDAAAPHVRVRRWVG